MQIITYDQGKAKIIEIRGQKVILDSDVAALYQVETKRVNEAVKNNQNKFPDGYIIELDDFEWKEVRSKFSTSRIIYFIPKSICNLGEKLNAYCLHNSSTMGDLFCRVFLVLASGISHTFLGFILNGRI